MYSPLLLSSLYNNPAWVALYANGAAVGAPVPGVVPHGPLTQAILSAHLLEQLALSTPNARHKEALQNVAKEIVAEATK